MVHVGSMPLCTAASNQIKAKNIYILQHIWGKDPMLFMFLNLEFKVICKCTTSNIIVFINSIHPGSFNGHTIHQTILVQF